MLDNQGVVEESPIGGFWLRLLAIILDSLFLVAIGIVLSFFFSHAFAQMGPWGRSVGFVIVLLYFGVLNSAIGNGQSLGKKITKIRVVNVKGENLSLVKSLVRSTILITPFFLNGALLPPSTTFHLSGMVIGFIIFVFGGGISYLYLFNRRTRQSLHDLMVGSYVVKASAKGPVAVPAVAKIHYGVIGVLAVSMILFSLVFVPHFIKTGALQGVMITQQKLNDSGKVYVKKVMAGKMVGADRTYSFVDVEVILKGKTSSITKEVNEIASLILSTYPNIEGVDKIKITVADGYDIGIAGFWRRYSEIFSPAEWKARTETK